MRGSALVIIATSVLLVGSATQGTSQTRKSQVVNIDAMHALWSAIKNQLMTAPNAEEYFRLNFKHADVPPLVGTLISAKPSQQPNTLVLGLSDASTPEVTVHLMTRNGEDDHLNGPLMLGSQVQFQGIPGSLHSKPVHADV